MTRKQKAELRLSEIRSKLNGYAGKDTLTAEETAEVEKAEGELRAAEVEHRAAIREEGETRPPDPQESALERRCELRRYVSAVVDGRAFDGAEAELQQHLKLSGHKVPLAAFAPVEQRADATTNAPATVGQSQRTVLGRVFARSSAQWLGVRMDQVPAGLPVYPVVSAGVTPSRLAAGAAHGDIAAGTIDSFSLSPNRSQVMYSYRAEDVAKMGQSLESALRADMSGAMSEHLDAQLIAGSGTAPNVPGFFNELTDPTNPTDAVTYTNFVGSVAGLVDGRYALTAKDARLLVGSDTYAKLAASFATSTARSAAMWAESEAGGLRTSAHVPAKSSNIQKALAVRRQNAGCAVCAHWPGIELIVDRVTKKKSGIVELSMIQLFAFKIVREAAFSVLEFKLA